MIDALRDAMTATAWSHGNRARDGSQWPRHKDKARRQRRQRQHVGRQPRTTRNRPTH